jgi:hypothetical protein
MLIDKTTYKGIEIESHYYKGSKSFYATSKVGTSIGIEYNNPQDAVKNVETIIDEFLKLAPKTYAELADAITESLVWTGYEDCHADEEIIKQLVSSFIKTQK